MQVLRSNRDVLMSLELGSICCLLLSIAVHYFKCRCILSRCGFLIHPTSEDASYVAFMFVFYLLNITD